MRVLLNYIKIQFKKENFLIYNIDIDRYQILRIKINIIKYYKFLCTRRYIYNTNMKNHD